MILIDTHSHLYLEEFEEDIEEVVARAKSVDIKKVLLPNIDINSIKSLKGLVSKFPDYFLPMMGLHPTSVSDDWKDQLDTIYLELDSYNYVAIGEVGIDLYWDKATLKTQQEVFETQLKWSIEKNLPVSIHSRNAISQVIESIRRVGAKSLHGVFHSFGGNIKELKDILKLENFYIGINGVITFKNAGLREIINECPIERIVLETDSPYLAPVPYRGKRNESSFLKEVAKMISITHNLSESDTAELTSMNACNIFNINSL